MIKNIFIKRSSCNYTHPHHPRYAEKMHEPPTKNTSHFKIISYNIKHSQKIAAAAKLIRHHQELNSSDVICVQEMTLQGIKHLAKDLQYSYVYYPAIVHPKHGQDFGNAILTRWRIDDDRKIILPSPYAKRLQRIAVGAVISLGQKKIFVYSIHMAVILKAVLRSHQIQTLIEQIPTDVNGCVVAGDFNTFSKPYHKAVIAPFHNAGFKNATAHVGWTYKHWYLLNKKTTLDHIFIRDIQLIKAGKILDWEPSDHLPIWAEVKFI
jgi:endonuclease/exonuclease/phosphatase family metal-dependent hydrolase